MCLAVTAKVMMIDHENRTALVDSFGIPSWVGITLIPDMQVNDYVLIHAGYALEKIDLQEAEERIKIWEDLLI